MASQLSWNLTQHGKIITPEEFVPFLELASEFEGKIGFAKELNEKISEMSILTENVRDGKVDIWRDYQQVLATLGCIVSTNVKKNLTLTQFGKLLVEKKISFHEYITIQALRFQYPNGNTTQSGIWKEQYQSGMLVKPALQLIRTIIELGKNSDQGYLTLNECQDLIVTVKNNRDLSADILRARSSEPCRGYENQHTRRNLQDWFKLLNQTEIFEVSGNTTNPELRLSLFALSNKKILEKLCERAERKEGFWKPSPEYSKSDKLSWFDFFGTIPSDSIESSLIKLIWMSRDDIFNDEEEKGNLFSGSLLPITLGPVESSIGKVFTKSNNELVASGVEARGKAHSLHDDIIITLQRAFENKGYSTFADPNSIDFLAEKEECNTYLAEVKTTTPINIIKQLRLGIGQLLEYGYRIESKNPNLLLVISSTLEDQSWYLEILKKYEISLISIYGKNVEFYPCSTNVGEAIEEIIEDLVF